MGRKQTLAIFLARLSLRHLPQPLFPTGFVLVRLIVVTICLPSLATFEAKEVGRMSLLAHLEPNDSTANRRSAARRTLRLQALGATASHSAADVIIHDLSLTGLLIETSAALAAGERIDVDIPEAGPTEAKVVWSSGRFFGCRFRRPLPPAALSSAPVASCSDRVTPARRCTRRARGT